MAQIVFSNVGEVKILDYLTSYFNSLRLYLYCNDYTPTCEDVIGDYTLCPDIAYETAPWGVVSHRLGRARLSITDDYFTFVTTGDTTVYGLVAVDTNESPDAVVFAGKCALPIDLFSTEEINISPLNVYLWEPFCPPYCT